jgi:hypothetical protein
MFNGTDVTAGRSCQARFVLFLLWESRGELVSSHGITHSPIPNVELMIVLRGLSYEFWVVSFESIWPESFQNLALYSELTTQNPES